MRAAIQHRYGPPEVLTIETRPRPEPGRGQLRVRISHSTVTSGDARIRGFRVDPLFRLPMRLFFGLRRPRQQVPGMEFAGVIDEMGPGVTHWRIGQRVFGLVLHGANAEWLVLPADAVMAPIPDSITNAEAAATPFGALHAWAVLHDVARARAGEHVLILGASGALGVFAVQLAKRAGLRVTAVVSAGNMKLMRELGADHVLDRKVTALPIQADILLDLFGGSNPVAWHRLAGQHIQLVFGARDLAIAAWRKITGGPPLHCVLVGGSAARLRDIAALLESGALRPVIDRVLPLEEVAEAHALVDSSRKRGAVVLAL